MLLKVEHLRVAFRLEGRISVPVRDVSFEIPENGRVALVGESGCGKSLSALSIGGLELARREYPTYFRIRCSR